MTLRGALRDKLFKPKFDLPRVFVKEPKLVVLPRMKEPTKVDVRYPLLEPFAHVNIKWDPERKELVYLIEEPAITPQEKETQKKIEEALTELIEIKLPQKNGKEATQYLHDKVRLIFEEGNIKVSKDQYPKIMYYIIRNFVGLNEIEPMMHDPYIEDLGCSGLGDPIYLVHRVYGPMVTNLKFEDFDYLNNFVIKLSERCGRYISYAKPLLDGTLPDGSRVQASMAKDVTTKGPTFSIRKFRKNPFSPIDLINMNTTSPDLMAYLWMLIENSASVLVCGGVASGKTTFLNSMTMFIPPEDKIVSIEDVREINIPHVNWIPATTRVGFGIPEVTGERYGEVTLFDLLKESFRMKPDYTIVGEVRGKEAYVLFQGMASGNPSLGTIHAGSVDDVIKRLESPPIELSPSLIEALDAIVVVVSAKTKGESARRVKELVEIQSVDPRTGRALTVKAFSWLPAQDIFKDNTQQSELLRRISFQRGVPYDEVLQDLKERAEVLTWMQRHDIYNFDEVSKLINLFYKDKSTIMEWVKKGLPPYKTKEKESVARLWDSSTGLRIWE